MADDLLDGSTNFSGGQDASKSPEQVAPNAYSSGVNVTTKQGVLSPRWGIEYHPLDFPDTEFTLESGQKKTYGSIFPRGKFQAHIPYSINNVFYQVIVISGIIYLVNQDTFEVKIIEIDDGSKLDEYATRINWTNAGAYLELFDYPAYPVIIEGDNARRANPDDLETPISVLGGFNDSRVFVGNNGNEFAGSDPIAYGFPFAPISFTELQTIGGDYFGQIQQINSNYNNDQITAIAFLQVIDRSTEIGPLLVSTENVIYSYQTQLPRDQWQTTGFGTVFITETGIAGARAFANVNSDLYFIDPENYLRSASMSRDEQKKTSKIPLSLEVENYLQKRDASLTQYSRVCYFKNKLFTFAYPYRTFAVDTELNTIEDVAFGGMVVLDFDNISSYTGGDGPPAWDGLWTGVRPMEMIVNNKRAFIMSKDDDGINRLYELNPKVRYDLVGEDKHIRKVKSRVYTREYTHQAPFSNKGLKNIEFSIRKIKGEFDLNVRYKTSQASDFIQWGKFSHIAPWKIFKLPSNNLNGLLPHEFREIDIGSPDEDTCNPVTEDVTDTFRKIQLLLDIEGIYWELEGFIIRATALPQNETEVQCEPYKIVEIPKEFLSDWLIPGDNLCQEISKQTYSYL